MARSGRMACGESGTAPCGFPYPPLSLWRCDMANARYDQTPIIVKNTDWISGRIIAFLVSGATFDSTDKKFSDLTCQRVNVGEILGRSVGPNGEALGLPAVFNVTPRGGPYQVILCWDQAQPDYDVLGFYDTDIDGNTLQLINNATYVYRAADADASGIGTWFVF